MKKVDLYLRNLKIPISPTCAVHVGRHLSLPLLFGLPIVGKEGSFLHVDGLSLMGMIMDKVEDKRIERTNGESNWFS